jgi:hypothetical protein
MDNMFSIHDATNEKLNLFDLIKLGCTRSSHVGLLSTDNCTLAPLIGGLNVHYHEFLKHANDLHYNICQFHLLKKCGGFDNIIISSDKNIWPPMARWNFHGRSQIIEADPRFSDLAKDASSPFSFHLAATKKIFSQQNNVTLTSSNFLKIKNSIDSSIIFLRQLLKCIASNSTNTEGRPKTFYRVIDENGISWYQKSIKKKFTQDSKVYEEISFDNGFTISIEEAIESVLYTFQEMADLEENPSFVLGKRPRIIMDTAFYIMMDFIMTGKVNDSKEGIEGHLFVSYHLAGNELMNYLIHDEKQALMYTKQVGKLIKLIAPVFAVNIPWVLKLVNPIKTIGYSQYSLPVQTVKLETRNIYPGDIIHLST